MVDSPASGFSLISIAGNPLIWVTATPKGILLSGHMYDQSGAVVKFQNNHFEVNKNLGFKPGRPDKHTIILYDNWDRVILKIRFANPHALEMQGVFFYPGRPPVIVDDSGIHYGANNFGGNCATAWGASKGFIKFD